MLFYNTKMAILDQVVNSTAQRKPDQAAPEITLDPLEGIGQSYMGISPKYYACLKYTKIVECKFAKTGQIYAYN